jgi:hypothetical protein
MPGIIGPDRMNTDGLAGIWSPVQWELTEEERVKELDTQSTASLMWSVDIPEGILRGLLHGRRLSACSSLQQFTTL